MRVVITGASSGIGEALARYYAAQGATLGLISRRHGVDVTDEAALAAAATDFMRRHGVPDLVIANAGIGSGTDAANPGDIPKLRKILDVNVIGLAATLAAFA
ncbi:MAG: short chain dehydrogenase, partial [Burkholderiales bacterium]|nr:short chain dehydrogenase [Burkholderiales bacterium]